MGRGVFRESSEPPRAQPCHNWTATSRTNGCCKRTGVGNKHFFVIYITIIAPHMQVPDLDRRLPRLYSTSAMAETIHEPLQDHTHRGRHMSFSMAMGHHRSYMHYPHGWVSASSAGIIDTCRVPAERVQLPGLTSAATASEEAPCQQEQDPVCLYLCYTVSLPA